MFVIYLASYNRYRLEEGRIGAYKSRPCGRWVSRREHDLWSRPMAMHYPRRVSTLKKKRAQGFRARMRTKSGRKIINARRRIGRRVGLKR